MVENCEIVTRSTVDGELSLFAGREWGESSEILEVAIGIPVKMDAIFGNLLINYVEGLNDSHALLALGQGMLLNHVNDRSQETVRKIMSPYSPLYEFKSHSGYSVDIAYELRGYVDVVGLIKLASYLKYIFSYLLPILSTVTCLPGGSILKFNTKLNILC
ncbi:hypothetical protein EON65_22165 [archaeon]|nr:MAG: hypothetical protein EON65_22165 [archaeon]